MTPETLARLKRLANIQNQASLVLWEFLATIALGDDDPTKTRSELYQTQTRVAHATGRIQEILDAVTHD